MPDIKFGNIDFPQQGAFVFGDGQFSAPVRSVSTYEVAGRSGSVIVDNGYYENISGGYTVVIKEDFERNLDRLKRMLYSQRGYKRLFDSDMKGFYRMACFYDGIEVIEVDAPTKVRVTFDCKPYKYAIDGDKAITLTTDGEILNRFYEPSKPQITVYGSGTCIVYINGTRIECQNVNEYVTIDADIQEAYKGEKSENANVNRADFELSAGTNYITFGGGTKRVDIVPRWVKL